MILIGVGKWKANRWCLKGIMVCRLQKFGGFVDFLDISVG